MYAKGSHADDANGTPDHVDYTAIAAFAAPETELSTFLGSDDLDESSDNDSDDDANADATAKRSHAYAAIGRRMAIDPEADVDDSIPEPKPHE